jgi:hypothetical protein
MVRRVEETHRRGGGGTRMPRKGKLDLRSLESELENVQVACLGAYAKFQNLKQSVEAADNNVKRRYDCVSNAVLVEELVELQEDVVSQKHKLARLRRKHAQHSRSKSGTHRIKPSRRIGVDSADEQQRPAQLQRGISGTTSEDVAEVVIDANYFKQIEESRKERVQHFAALSTRSRQKLCSLVGFIDCELSKLHPQPMYDPIRTNRDMAHISRREFLAQCGTTEQQGESATSHQATHGQSPNQQGELTNGQGERQRSSARRLSAMANFPACKRDRVRMCDLKPVLRSKTGGLGHNRQPKQSNSTNEQTSNIVLDNSSTTPVAPEKKILSELKPRDAEGSIDVGVTKDKQNNESEGVAGSKNKLEELPGDNATERRSNLSKIIRPHTGRAQQRNHKTDGATGGEGTTTSNEGVGGLAQDEQDGGNKVDDTAEKLKKYARPNDLSGVRRGSSTSTEKVQ